MDSNSIVEKTRGKNDDPYVTTQPFFGTGKKYGACPICAAVIIVNNEETSTSCPNCKVQLTLS